MEFRSVEAIVRVLNERNVRYLVVGGLAVNAHGYERLTRDIDLVISLEHDNIITALSALESIGFHPSIPITKESFAKTENRNAWKKDKGMVVLKLWSDTHARTVVDVFTEEPFDFDEEHRNRRCEEIEEGLPMPFVRLETLMEMKRQAGRPQDLLDIENLRKLNP